MVNWSIMLKKERWLDPSHKPLNSDVKCCSNYSAWLTTLMSQPSSSQSGREENFGWPGALPGLKLSIYRDTPWLDFPCRVFLGPGYYSDLRKLLEGFDNSKFSGIVLTTCSGALSPGQQEDFFRLIMSEVTGHVELRHFEYGIGHEKVIKKITSNVPPHSRLSSSFSIHVDHLNDLTEAAVQKLCTLPNLELVHLLAPERSLLRGDGSVDPSKNSLEIIWKYTGSLRKCILPLDLFDKLGKAFKVLRCIATLSEIELTSPVNDEVLQCLHHPQSGRYEPTMIHISPKLAQLKKLEAITIPVEFVTAAFLSSIASLPCLITFTIVLAGTKNPVRHLIEALMAVPIHKKGSGCFEKLTYLDLGSCDELQRDLHVRNAPEHFVHCQELRKIFVNTVFCGGDHLFGFLIWLETHIDLPRRLAR